MTAADDLRALLGGLDHPMYVLTVAEGDERSGCLVGFACQCSIEPVRFLVCVSRVNHTFPLAMRADHVAVHLAPDEPDLTLARLFGEQTGDDVDKFDRCGWSEGPEGQTVLDGCPAWFVGHVLDRFDLGDHVGLVLEPVAVHGRPEGYLCFERAKGLEAGHPA